MRSTKSIILLVIALGCGTIAFIGMRSAMARPESDPTANTETIFVAASSVPSWSKLAVELVKEEEWPIDKIPQGAARTLEEFQGKSSLYPLYAGEPIILTKLSDGDGKIASVRIPEGHQVFAVKVDKESALSGLIHPGDKVDILVFIRGRASGPDQIRTGTRTILRNTTVFAVNDQIARSQEGDSTIDTKTVSLLVLPEQSERLLLAKQLGTIHLALRKPGDETNMQTEGAQPGDLDQSSEGSDGIVASNDSNTKDGIFDILKDMKTDGSTAVDSSSATEALAQDAGTSMVIMSPDGVLGQYTFTNNTSEANGMPALPAELLSGHGGDARPMGDSAETADSEPTSADDIPADDIASPDDDGPETKVDVLDPADLGL
jgi:pilus assembly protein CpaB